jgi:hypothetical protein
MQETLTGRHFVDLEKIENDLNAFPGVKSSEAYICYGENNKLVLTAEIAAENETEISKLQEYLAIKGKESAQPVKMLVNGNRII